MNPNPGVPFLRACRAGVLLLGCIVAAVAAAAETYKVKPGDTLDKVIRQTMGDSPLRVELLRQAFVQQNPQAFSKSSPRVLIPGSVLNVPDHNQLLRQHLQPRDGTVTVSGPVDYNARKNWIRFP